MLAEAIFIMDDCRQELAWQLAVDQPTHNIR